MLLLFQGKGRQGHNDHYSTSNIPSRKVREHHTRLHTHHHHPNIPLNRSTQPKLLTIQIRLLKPTPGSMMEQDLDKVITMLEGKSSNERPPPRKKSRLFFGLRVRGRKKHDSKCSLSLIRSPAAAGSLAGGLSLHGQRHGASHGAVLERVQHLQVPPGLAPLQVGHVLPETVHAGQGHQPLRVQLPGVSASNTSQARVRTWSKRLPSTVFYVSCMHTSPRYAGARPGRSCSSGSNLSGTSQRSPRAGPTPCRPGTGQCGSQTRRAR